MIWRREHRRRWYLLGMMMVLAVLYSSLVPGEDLPAVGMNDKLEHGIAYAVLALWFGGLLSLRHYGWLAAGLLALGGGVEIAQGLMQLGRTADWYDFWADAAGVGAGLLLCLLGLRHWASVLERRLFGT